MRAKRAQQVRGNVSALVADFDDFRGVGAFTSGSIFAALGRKVAARRVVADTSEVKGLVRPTACNRPIDNKAKKLALSNGKSTRILSSYIKPEHKRMSRMLGCTLTLGTREGWHGFSVVAAACMSANERSALAFAALNSLELDQAEATAAASIGAAGAPLPPFLGGMDEARFWASYANRSELKAYALAAFEAMQANDRTAFLSYANGEMAE
jgi:hypothetical protein